MNQSFKNNVELKNSIFDKIQRQLNAVKENRCGPSIALNYDPMLMEEFKSLRVFANALDLPPMAPDRLLDSVYGHMSMACHARTMLPPHLDFSKWLSEYGTLVAPEFIQTYKMLVLAEDFKPEGVEIAKFATFVDAPPTPKYQVPAVDPAVILSLAQAAAEDPNATLSVMGGYSMTYDGVPTRFITAQDPLAVAEANQKFCNYKATSENVDANDLYLCAQVIVQHLGSEYDPELADIFQDVNTITSKIDKDTSMGYSNIHFFDQKEGVSVEVPKPKKRDALEAQQANYFQYLAEMRAYIRGEIEDIPYPGPLYEAHKQEIITYLELFEERDEYMSADDKHKALMKQRLFYMSASLALMVDNAVFKPLINSMRYWLSAIGIQVTSGGLLEMWDMVLGKRTSPLKVRWRRVARYFKSKYGIDLNEREYGEGDWSSYDTTLSAMVMAFAVSTAFSNFSESSDPLIRLLAVTAHGQSITKVMYMYLADQYYRVHGRMFSGVLITSTVDTIYQIILYLYYMKKLMGKYRDDEKLREICSAFMFIMFFYGDDHVAGWPKYMNKYKLYPEAKDVLDDFVIMCQQEFGMIYKRSASKRFDDSNVIGEIHFYTDEKGIPRELEELTSWGMTFLKFSVVQVYVDGMPYMAPIPMKPPKDAIAKLGLSMSSSKNISLEAAKVVALAYLNTHLEVHHQLKMVYDKLIQNGASVTQDVMALLMEKPDSMSMFMLSTILGQGGDVSFPTIEENYRKQYKGYFSRKGFVPLTPMGAEKTLDEKISMWRMDDWSGSIIPADFF